MANKANDRIFDALTTTQQHRVVPLPAEATRTARQPRQPRRTPAVAVALKEREETKEREEADDQEQDTLARSLRAIAVALKERNTAAQQEADQPILIRASSKPSPRAHSFRAPRLTVSLAAGLPQRRRTLLMVLAAFVLVGLVVAVPLSPVRTSPFGQWLTNAGGAPEAMNDSALRGLPYPNCSAASEQCIQALLPYAEAAHTDTHWPVSLILAQWTVEHGWKFPDFDGYNFGNVRPTGHCPILPSDFCYAATPIDGLNEYVGVAHLGYYTAIAPAAAAGGPNAAARALGASPWDAGHYTHDGIPGDMLLAMMRAHNLYQYD